MTSFWNGLSPFTRRFAMLVILCSVVGLYTKARLKPLRAELEVVRASAGELRSEVRRGRERVAQLERESETAMRWASYSRILEEQSTGRSLREILAACGTGDGPPVEVLDARFERHARGARFERMGVRFRVAGEYDAIIDLLDELDRGFPPIELRSARLQRPEAELSDRGHRIVADLDGVIHEPR